MTAPVLEELRFIVDHLFLPKQLPQSCDITPEKEVALVLHVLKSAEQFKRNLPQHEPAWDTVSKMLCSFKDLIGIGLQELQLKNMLVAMNVGDVIPLHIEAQNAGVILRRSKVDLLTVEYFQASPRAAEVTSTSGKLVVQFPHCPRSSMPFKRDGTDSLGALLATLHRTEMRETYTTTVKAGTANVEIREVNDIRYVSELLGGIVAGQTKDPEAIASSTQWITKRLGDHVLWKHARLPWRRSPKWLVIRVAIQTTLKEFGVLEDGPTGYKAFVTFVLSQTLESALDSSVIPDHLLFEMNAKVALRLDKIARGREHELPPTSHFPFRSILDVMTSVKQRLERNWEDFQSEANPPLTWVPPSLQDVLEAQRCELIHSKSEMEAVRKRRDSFAAASPLFDVVAYEFSLRAADPTRPLTATALSCTVFPKPLDLSASDEDLWVSIVDVEGWIGHGHLSRGWYAASTIKNRMDALLPMIAQFEVLSHRYKGTNGARFSRVFLILLELWVAMDQTVVQEIPILADYSPEFIVSSLEPLLLPERSQMERLAQVEKHITTRISARLRSHSAFKLENHSRAFGARYFEQSYSLRDLKERIQLQANQDESAKIREYQVKTRKYERLIQDYDRLSCQYNETVDRWGFTQTHHSPFCLRCAKYKEAQDLTIHIFERPLPKDSNLADLVVFELDPPPSYSHWRDVTYRLSRAFALEFVGPKEQPLDLLSSYSQLKLRFAGVSNRSLTLGSRHAKSFLVTHYNGFHFPCSKDDIVKPNGLQYEMYGRDDGEWLDGSGYPCINIRPACTPAILPGAYANLWWTLQTTSHTPNQVLASQSRAHNDLTIDEYLAFGHVRAGIRLQIRNIVLGLVAHASSLKSPVVYLLYRQASWQVEARHSSGGVLREAHLDMKEEAFGVEMLGYMKLRLGAIKDNWQDAWVTTLLSVLACRLRVITSSDNVRDQCVELLAEIRAVVMGYIGTINELLQKPPTDDPQQRPVDVKKDLRVRLVHLAATCRSTYAAKEHIATDFDNSEAVYQAVYCNMLISNNLAAGLSSFLQPLKDVLEAAVCLSAELLPRLREALRVHPDAFDRAVRKIWDGYRRDELHPWAFVGSRWLGCRTSSAGGRTVRFVHLNLLDGRIRIDGKALDTLPPSFVRAPLYQTLFPRQDHVEISPSTMQGMEYQLRYNVCNQEVHFLMRPHLQLIIRLRDSGDESTSEFVSPGTLEADIPRSILNDSILIFHDSSQSLDIHQSVTSGWNGTSNPDWCFDMRTYRVSKVSGKNEVVLSPHSKVVKHIYAQVKSLEVSPLQLLVILGPRTYSTSTAHYAYNSRHLLIDLPRYRLSFFLNERLQLASRQFPHYTISREQDLGTLGGLKSKLVLCSHDHLCGIIPVSVGAVKADWEPQWPAPRVTVDIGSSLRHVQCLVVDQDTLLGRLPPQTSTLSTWFYLAYLHLLTSSHMSDRLTDQTGVQTALSMLSSARSISFMEFDQSSHNTLMRIASCTPERAYYPKHLTCMETISWHSNIPPLLQEDRLTYAVQRIMQHVQDVSLFDLRPSGQRPAANVSELLKRTNADLTERAIVRFARLIPHNRILAPNPCDTQYSMAPLDRCEMPALASISKEVNQRPSEIAGRVDFWELYSEWGTFSSQPIPNATLETFSSWISDSPAAVWFTFIELCRTSVISRGARSKLAFLLPILAYRRNVGIGLARSLLLIAIHASRPASSVLSAISGLPRAKFTLSHGTTVTETIVQSWLDSVTIPFSDSSQSLLSRQVGETKEKLIERQHRVYNAARSKEHQRAIAVVLSHWPHGEITWRDLPQDLRLVEERKFCAEADAQFRSRFNNLELHRHAVQLTSDVSPYSEPALVTSFLPSLIPHFDIPRPRYRVLDLQYLIANRSPRDTSSALVSSSGPSSSDTVKTPPSPHNVRDLADRLSAQEATGDFIHKYAQELYTGIDALKRLSSLDSTRLKDRIVALPRPDLHLASIQYSIVENALDLAGLFPSSEPLPILRELAERTPASTLSDPWTAKLKLFAVWLAQQQRSARIEQLRRSGREADARKEESTIITEDGVEDISWLLCQLDSDFTIRAVQNSIARAMMEPPERGNSLRQLNMGEGKTSVIMPIISASLADGTRLTRVVVLTPLAGQSFQILTERLSGILNRPIFYLPFSRDVPIDSCTVSLMKSLMERCRRDRGVMLCQPEHILSLHLMMVHYFCGRGENDSVTQSLLQLQHFLDAHTRDILDESDELLKVKYQLIYTIGAPRGLSGQPVRWELIQDVLDIFAERLRTSAIQPDSIEVVPSPHSNAFFRTRFLEPSAGSSFLDDVGRAVVYDDALRSFSFRHLSNGDRDDLYAYISMKDVFPELEERVIKTCEPFLEVLVLRGLFAHGLLAHVFSDKRFRVDYGLHLIRTPLAVPYRSKDQPALRAEYGHPDVILLLTLLSYYYGGLSDSQLDVCFDILLKSDNPALRYEDWIKTVVHDLPSSLRTLNGLNLEDIGQKLDKIFPLLRFNKSVIDFYVSQIVFPKAREFPYKLTTNAWDLAKTKQQWVTGFSGTKDNSWLLPLSIQQAQSPEHQHTDALVMSYLLEPRNACVVLTGHADARSLLGWLSTIPTRPSILLDVGAQILELDNLSVAREWLKMDACLQYEAAVYFHDTKDEPFVLHRDGHVECFAESLYRTQLDKCFVYLDEAHTRGTDFKFAPSSAAVVTLGPSLTKDKLVQGCMRMRRLAEDHSVVFFCPREVELKMKEITGKSDSFDSSDVLLWTMIESCRQIETSMHLWRHQGFNFDCRSEAFAWYSEGSLTAEAARDILQEPEARTIQQMYGLHAPDVLSVGMESKMRKEILRRCKEFGLVASSDVGSMLEEQERELANEKEDEREIERAGPATPLAHTYDRALEQFVQRGKIASHWLSLKDCLAETTALQLMPSGNLFASRRVLATQDFRDTIATSSHRPSADMSDFLRPVQWLLSSDYPDSPIVLISPHEANMLFPTLRQDLTTPRAYLHIYAPRVSRNVQTFENLDFLTFPKCRAPDAPPLPKSMMIHELNMFSGQLFFRDRTSSEEVCQWLGLCLGKVPQGLEGKVKVDAGGFMTGMRTEECAVDQSPVKFLRELVACRRKGQGFTLTDIGRMLYGQDFNEGGVLEL